LFTHFARADEDIDSPLEGSHVRLQADRFICVKKALERAGVKLFCHVCNSAAAYRFPELAFDGVRLGIMLYGVRSGECFDERLQPVMKLCSTISHVHTLHPGEGVGYGGTFSSNAEKTIATLPIGYADGFSRSYSGCCVTVHTAEGDFKAKVVGRVCMDQCMIDVTDMPVRVGDGVTVFGHDGEALGALAEADQTIEYECLCRISARVPRIIKNSIK
jgi:alanine racemase